eukprot:Gb_12907 [translate_table: standard]
MKAIDIFCASPASTAICLSLEQRSLVRQGSRVLEQSRLLERQGSRVFEPSNMLLEQGRSKERPRRSHGEHRRNHHNHNADQNSRAGLEQKPRRSRHRSSSSSTATNSKSRFSCSAIDQSAIIPFTHSSVPKSVPSQAKPINDVAQSSSSGPSEVVVLRVSLHCQGCAGKVKKHISKMEGVTSVNIDLAKQKVTVVGHVTPVGVLESVSRVKNAEFWPTSSQNK